MEENKLTPAQPENYLVWAILVTVCCCLPFGIVAIVKSSKVNTLYAAGQYDMAQLQSQDTKKWCIIGAVTGLIIEIIYFIIYGAAALASLSNM